MTKKNKEGNVKNRNTKKESKKTVSKVENTKDKNKKTQPKKKKVYNNNDLIEVMSYVTGGLVYINQRTQERWTWGNFGDIQLVPYIELKNIRSSHSKFLSSPWMIILDDDIVELMGLQNLYKNIIKPDDMDRFFNLEVDEMAKILEKAPSNMRRLIAELTRDNIKNKKFGDLFKIKLIEETLNISLLDTV